MRSLIVTLLLCGIALGAAPGPAQPVPATPPSRDFGWPLAGPTTVTRPFDLASPLDPGYGPGHRGVDLAGSAGQTVLAAGEGIVVHAGWLVDRPLISLAHAGDLRTTYEPVAPSVRVGQRVARGEPLGQLLPGHPECTAEPDHVCLHWGARRGRNYLDPLRLLGQGKVRLLPWD